MKKAITVMAVAAMASISNADLTGVTLSGTGAVDRNLTTEGSTDWVLLGRGVQPGSLANRDEKAGGSAIGAVTVTGTLDSWDDHPNTYDWTDGDTSGNGIAIGNQEFGNWESKPLTGLDTTNQALTFAVSNLAVGDYTMNIYAGSYTAVQVLTATMNGGTSMSANHAESNDMTTYAIDFTIDDVSDVLDVRLNRGVGTGNQYSNVSISAMTIAAIPEPGTLGLIGAAGGALLFIRRRFMI